MGAAARCGDKTGIMTASSEANATALVARALDIQGQVLLDDDMASLPAWTSLTHVKLILEIEAALGRQLSAEEIGSIDLGASRGGGARGRQGYARIAGVRRFNSPRSL